MLQFRLVLLLAVSVFVVACSDSVSTKDDGPIDINGDPVCGNGLLDEGEACDGAALNGTSCESLGLGAGELACRTNCSDFDRSACGAPDTCGDASVQAPEVCDGADLSGATCESLGFGPGMLACSANCAEFDTTMCGAVATCGNGQIDENELCDGNALGGATCESLGEGTGTLACADNCQQYVTVECSAGCTPQCGARACGPDPECGTSCGTCGADELCSADGMCVCQPTTCDEVGAQCGTIDDGCGGTLDCGGCDGAEECGAGGTPNVCACPAVSSGGRVDVDVPVVDVSINLTVGGQALTTSNTTYRSQGAIELVDTVTGDRISFGNASNTNEPTGLGYPTTRRLVPGTYDVIYDSFSQNEGTFWPLNSETVIQSDVDLTTSQTLDVDIPVVDVSFGVTVGGQTLNTTNTTYRSQGAIEVLNSATGDRLSLGNASNTNNPSGLGYPVTKRLVPGTYDVLYDSFSQNEGTFWPLNNDAVLLAGESLTSTRSLTVDVPVADVTFDVTVGGQALNTTNTTYRSQGSIEVVDTDTGDRLSLGNASNTENPSGLGYPVTKRLVPGTYDVLYDSFSQNEGNFWPLNNDAVLRAGESINATRSIMVDVPVVDVTFDVTVGGQALNTTNTTYRSQGSIEVVDTAAGDRLSLGNASNTENPSGLGYPVTRRLVPGTYDVLYDSFSQNEGTFWPLNNDAVLRSGESLTSTRSITVDVPVVDVTFDVTVGGQALNTTNTTYRSQGSIEVVDTATGDRLSLGNASNTENPSGLGYPVTRRLVPGTYDVLYDSFSQNEGTFWPLNNDAVLRADEALTSTRSLTIDVPVVDVSFGVTVGGQALNTSNTTYRSQGALEVVYRDTGDRLSLGNASNTENPSGLGYPVTKRLVPGDYDVLYNSFSQNEGSFWPLNNDAVLTCFSAR